MFSFVMDPHIKVWECISLNLSSVLTILTVKALTGIYNHADLCVLKEVWGASAAHHNLVAFLIVGPTLVHFHDLNRAFCRIY